MLNMTEWFTEWYWTYDFFKLFQVFKTFHLFISFPPLISAALHLLRSLHLLRLNFTSLDWEARGCAGSPSIFAACCWSSCSGVVTRGNDCPIWLPKTINFCIVLSFYFRFFPQNLGDLSYFHLPSIQKDQLYEKCLNTKKSIPFYLEAIVQQPLVNTASSLPTTGVAARVPTVPQGSIIFHCCKTAKLAKRLLTEESFCTHKIFLFCLNISVFHFYFSHLSAIPSGISSFSLVEEEASWSSDVQVVTHRHDSSKMWYAIRTTWHLE